MARKLRLESEGGIYHVISRGNYRAPVFRADKTKEAFLNCLDEACLKTGWRVHAWCGAKRRGQTLGFGVDVEG